MTPRRLSRTEFIAMMALLYATVAFSIDAMLPALPEIGAELTPDKLNQAQFVVTLFVAGMGTGTLLAGPLSDALGRKPVILGGAALYMVGAFLAGTGETLEAMLLGRFVQGLGAAGPRVVALAVVRDLYSGRDMARIVSFVMMIFTLLPALAPTVGAGLIALFGWRGIFGAFVVFALISVSWYAIRQPETLPPARRRQLATGPLMEAAREVFADPVARTATLVQTLIFSVLFMVLTSTQQIFDQYFGRGDTFHWWFGLIAVISGSASFLNAMLVGRMGMRFLIRTTLIVQLCLSALMAVTLWAGLWPAWAEFPAYVIWSITIFGMLGLTIGNLNALAMEPLGHIAGMAASIIGALATVMSAVLAMPVGQLFDGTPRPLATGALLAVAGALILMRRLPDR
ncbi:multidrug effflux MFS transporter [Rhodovulum adriaticum]|uniref:DHA1 family bicyclomycin/chloramphenicol resistance-like MFS transporter n=1 Tax=Rhodovulum adriaticum TaxID=35804 RepID=A0A4R2NUR8_RHOAD|nr:multidrug effflux MFS transporter [Rhodovulum adriaticum]MBK1635065.1 multidrug MFS transporter [Rhodovulum adriaticum]TCP25301.1 DHA1 family bicyclomycin/chloramphenicol resistance-like MFS transporter [Rhodovulum adriaticum]